jgi:hypothetical protein
VSVSRRQRLHDEVAAAAAAFASKLVDALVEYEHTEADNDGGPAPRRKPVRAAYVPTHGQPIDPALAAKARADARRRGL